MQGGLPLFVAMQTCPVRSATQEMGDLKSHRCEAWLHWDTAACTSDGNQLQETRRSCFTTSEACQLKFRSCLFCLPLDSVVFIHSHWWAGSRAVELRHRTKVPWCHRRLHGGLGMTAWTGNGALIRWAPSARCQGGHRGGFLAPRTSHLALVELFLRSTSGPVFAKLATPRYGHRGDSGCHLTAAQTTTTVTSGAGRSPAPD
jgi:hypothetical protein